MRLEFEPNASALPFVENEVFAQSVSSEVEKMLREGIKAAQDGNRAEARNSLLRVTEADANNENAWLWLASISEYPEELLVFLNNVLRINPTNERALEWHKATKSLLAKTLVQRGIDSVKEDRKDFARQCFEQALEHEAENEMAWLWMASVADSEEEKTACFEKVLSVNPDNETAQSSLNTIKSQKTQKLFQEALSAAFDGNHDAAMEMLETVLNQDSKLEDAWILKSHLASSFEDRAECFLQLRAINPENEMAKANLASWRMLADKVATQPKMESVQQVSPETIAVEAESREELSVESIEAEESAEFSTKSVSEESPIEESVLEECSADFSDFSAAESFVESEPEPATEDFTAENEDENLLLEFNEPEAVNFAEVEEESVQPQPKYFTDEELYSDEFSQPDNPTQDLSSDLNSQPEQEFADFTVQEDVPAEQETDSIQFTETQAEFSQSEEKESSFEEFQDAEVQFESSKPREVSQEVSTLLKDLVAETEAEESEMNWAFNESDDIHKTQSQDVHSTYLPENHNPANNSHEFSSESELSETQSESADFFAEMNREATNDAQESEEWKNTSPNVFVNYAPTDSEVSSESQPAEFAEIPTVEEFASAEMVVAEESSLEVSEVPEAESDAPEMLAENNDLNQFEENTEESFSAEETVEVADKPIEEQVSMQAKEVVEPQPKEEISQPKVEMALCPFCNAENEKQAFSCGSCQTILTLSDLEMLLSQQSADLEKLQQTVESLERENESYGLNAEQLANLGIGHINLKNHRQGFYYLQEAVRMNPNNVLLDAQVNALAIRLSEIEEQQSVHDSMPKNRKILVVDDSPTVRKLISGKLEKCGHEVVCAVDGIDALEKINALVPDLILLDITMPRMDGYQVCKLIRTNETTKDVPVVMISGKDGFFDKVRGRMAGTTGYITKPFGPETLMKTVETYLN